MHGTPTNEHVYGYSQSFCMGISFLKTLAKILSKGLSICDFMVDMGREHLQILWGTSEWVSPQRRSCWGETKMKGTKMHMSKIARSTAWDFWETHKSHKLL